MFSPADESRASRQLALIQEIGALFREAGIPYWLRGGWALDFLLGRITRAHRDIDLFVWGSDRDHLAGVLQANGYASLGGPPPQRQRNFEKKGEQLHVAFLERDDSDSVFVSTFQEIPWPQGMLKHPPGRIGDLSAPIISPSAQLWAKQDLPRILGDPPREYDPSDVRLLRAALDG